MMSEKKGEWIYNEYYPGPTDDLGRRIFDAEEALGFKLFFWQQTYIRTGKFRQYGATTAEILRTLLLNPEDTPLDYTKPAPSIMEQCKRQETVRIWKKLKEHGVPCRDIKLYAHPIAIDEEELACGIADRLEDILCTKVKSGLVQDIVKEELKKASIRG